MRIGVDVRELQEGVWTGIGRVVEAFLSEAPSLSPDVELFLYADRATRPELEKNGFHLRRLPQPSTLWFDQLALPRALRRDRVHVFFSPYYKAPLFSPCPAVATIHDVLFLKVGDRRLKHALFKPWARLIASRCESVLTDSEQSRRDLEEVLKLSPSKLSVIPLGVSERYSPSARDDSPQLLERLAIESPYILNVTNFRPHKNAVTLVRAFAELAAGEPELSLVLAGRHADPVDEILALVERHGLEGRVHLTGPIPDADLPALYAGARMFAFPSRYEGFGLPILEAMASGVPVVCSNTSSLPEVAGDAAILVEPDEVSAWRDALGRLATDASLRMRLRDAGLARAREFTWSQSVARILSVLHEVAAS